MKEILGRTLSDFFMDIITSLSRKELEQIITDSVTKCLNDKLNPPQEPLPDRVYLEEACSILNLSAPSIYQLTHAKKLPHMKFGSKLVFSRRQLLQYREERTVNAVAEDEAFLLNNLSKSALKKLKNAEIKGAS